MRSSSEPPDEPGSIQVGRGARDAAVTRAKLLHSAARLFSVHAYSEVGIRDIARSAGVDASLALRYFRSKKQLFSACVDAAFAQKDWLSEERSTFGQRLTACPAEPRQLINCNLGLLILLHSCSNDDVADIVRRAVAQHLMAPLAQWLGGEDANDRAAAIVGLLMGGSVLPSLIASAPSHAGMNRMARIIQKLVDIDQRPAEPRDRAVI